MGWHLNDVLKSKWVRNDDLQDDIQMIEWRSNDGMTPDLILEWWDDNGMMECNSNEMNDYWINVMTSKRRNDSILST